MRRPTSAINRAEPLRSASAGYTEALQTAKSSASLHANGFASLPIETGAIREAWPFHVSVDARKEEDAQPRPKHDIGSLAALKMQGAVSAAGVVF
jgi:hypothetical protein